MGLVEQGAGMAERPIGRESSEGKEDDDDWHEDRCPFQDDPPPGSFRALSLPATVRMWRGLAVLSPVLPSVTIRMGTTLPPMSECRHSGEG